MSLMCLLHLFPLPFLFPRLPLACQLPPPPLQETIRQSRLCFSQPLRIRILASVNSFLPLFVPAVVAAVGVFA